MEGTEEKKATEMFSWEEMAKFMGNIENVSPWTEIDWGKKIMKRLSAWIIELLATLNTGE